MEDTNIDGFTKKVMADSYTTLNDPEFTKSVMHKILQQEKRKAIKENIFYFLMIMISSGVVIFFVLNTFQQKIFGLNNNLNNISNNIWLNIEKGTGLIQSGEFFIFPLIIMLVLKNIVDVIINRRRQAA